MNHIEILILAVIQGVTEFLPVSSSGHLVVVEAIMGATQDVADVNIVLHVGTLISILIFYRRKIVALLTSDRTLIGPLVVGTIPAVIVGFTVKKFFESWLESPLIAGAALPITGAMLLWISRREVGCKTYQKLTYTDAWVIGCFQAVAVIPGISRSGSTIVAGMLRGMNRSDAATFSFLLAIPVIGGAAVLEFKDLLKEEVSTSISYLAMGAAVSCVVGLVALSWLNRWIDRGRLHYFAYWCIPVGVSILVWRLFF